MDEATLRRRIQEAFERAPLAHMKEDRRNVSAMTTSDRMRELMDEARERNAERTRPNPLDRLGAFAIWCLRQPIRGLARVLRGRRR